MVVEDDDEVRRVTVRSLRRAGFDVLDAASLEEAVAKVQGQSRRPAALLTDVRMPGHSGPEVSAALAGMVPGLRTVYMSGYSAEEIAAQGLRLDGGLFIQKPFLPDDLVQVLRDALAATAG